MYIKKHNCCDSGQHEKCGKDVDAGCVVVEGINPPAWSKHHRERCLSIGEILQDLYDAVSEIKDAIDVTELGTQCETCLDYGVSDKKELTVGRVLYAMENKVCG